MQNRLTATKSDLEKLVAMKAELLPAINAMKELEKKVKESLLLMPKDHAESLKVDGVDITYRSAHARSGWDSKKLEEIGGIIPEVLEAKKETAVKENFSFKFL